MADLEKGVQRGGGSTGGITAPREGESEKNRGAEFGSSEPGTAGTNRDADRGDESKNEGHGHPREERNRRGE